MVLVGLGWFVLVGGEENLNFLFVCVVLWNCCCVVGQGGGMLYEWCVFYYMEELIMKGLKFVIVVVVCGLIFVLFVLVFGDQLVKVFEDVGVYVEVVVLLECEVLNQLMCYLQERGEL